MYDTIYKKDILNLMNDGILIYSAVYDFKKGNVPVYAGHVGDNSCYVTSSHMHDRFEVVLITEGSARYKVNMQWYTAQKGDLVIVNPYELHYGEVNKNVGFFSYVCFMCDLKFMERENAVYPYRFIKEIADGKTKITNYVPEHDGNGLNLFIKDAYEAHLKRPDDWSVLVNAHLLGFFSGLSERKLIAASAAPNEHNRFVKDVIDYILNNYRRPITSADGAAALGFNNSYFCRAFKKYFYTTFGEYLYDFRLNQSKILIDLLDRADNIRSIAKKVGFSSYNYFSSAFHEKFGIQPSVYRRTLQNSALHIAGTMANLKGTANSFRMTQITERRDFETRGDLLRFFLVKSGETVVRIDRSEEKLLKDGDMLLLNPGESAVFNPQNPAEYAAVLLELDAEWLKGYYSAPFNDFLDALKKGACKLNHLVPARLASSIFFGQDRRMARCQTPEENAAVKGLLLLFLSKLRSRKYYTENETNQDEGFKKVISEYLQKNFADNITAADAAHYSGYTKNYFCVLFKRNFASAFKTYVSRYRVNAALKKIYDGEKDITKIAFDVGFNNVSYFSKVFRQLLDYSPNSIIKAKQQKAAESALLPPARSRKPLAKGR